MITDDIKNIDTYSEIPEKVKEFIKTMPENIALGRHELYDGHYVNIEVYDTKTPEKGVFESHEKYIDIQIILSGTERIDFINTSELSVDIPYNEEKDIIFYKRENLDAGRVVLRQRQFAIFYPYEAHMPQLNAGSIQQEVKKAVVKIKINA